MLCWRAGKFQFCACSLCTTTRKLEWLPGSPPEGPPCPREGEPGRERLRACRSTAPWEGHGAPSEKSTKPREAHLSSRPPTSASTFRRRRGVFQDRGQARSLPRSPCPSAQNKVRSKCSHCRSTRSCLNVISVDRTWRGLNLSCRQTLVRLRPS